MSNNTTLYLLFYTLGCCNYRGKNKKYKLGKLCDWCNKFNIFDDTDICVKCETDMHNEIQKIKQKEDSKDDYDFNINFNI